MTDRLNVSLDGSELIRGTNAVSAALAELRATIAALDKLDPAKNLKAQLQGMVTAGTNAVQEIEKVVGQVSTAIGQAQSAAAASGKKTGKAFAAGVSEGMEESVATVKAARQALQAEYEKAVASGFKVKEAALLHLKNMGVALFPEDRARVKAALDANKEAITQIEARARAEVKAAKDSLRAWQEDLDGYNNMLRLRVNAQAKAVEDLRKSEAALKKSNERAWLEDLDGYNNMLRLRVASEAKAAEQIAAMRMGTLAGVAKSQFNAASLAPSGAYSSIVRGKGFGSLVEPSTAQEWSSLTQVRSQTALLAEEKRKLAERSRDVHSAFRGLSAAGGALFLTYGSLVPLVTAFFAASAVKSAIQDYKDLEYQLKFVQAISGDASVSITRMMESIQASARAAGESPVEAAKGLRILAQAGLSTQDALNTLPEILRLSTLGEIGLQQAAETATGAVHAFGTSMDSVGHVVDVFVKAAAISNTSVGAIAESMKQASSVSQQYKLSIEDVSTALVALATRNTPGSAAVTAFRNLMDELAAPRGEAKQVAGQLGITLFDPLKHDAKQFFENFLPQLREKLQEFNPESQNYILNRLTNNRGSKALYALLGLSDDDLADIKRRITESTGYAIRAQQDLNDGVQGDLKKLKAAWETTLGGAGAGGSEQLRKSLQELERVVSSQAVQDGVAALVTGFTAVLRLVTMSADGLSRLYGLIDPLTNVKKLLEQIGAINTDTDKTDKALSNIDRQIEKEREYQASLQSSIDKLKVKLGYQSLTQDKDAQDFQTQLERARQVMESDREKFETRTGRKVTDIQAPKWGFNNPLLKGFDQGLLTAYVKSKQEYEALQGRGVAFMQARERSMDMQRELAKYEKEADEKAHKTASGALGSGTRSFTMPSTGVAGQDYKNELHALQLKIRGLEQLGTAYDQSFRIAEEVLQRQYEGGLIKYADYQQSLTEITRAQRDARLYIESEEQKKLQEALDDLKAKTEKKAYSASVSAPRGQASAAAQAVRDAAANDIEALQQQIEQSRLRADKANLEFTKREFQVREQLLRPGAEMVRNAEKESAVLQNNIEQELQKLAIKHNGATLSEKEAFTQAEVLRITNAQVDALARYKAELQRVMDTGVTSMLGDDGLGSPEALAYVNNLQAAIARTSGQIAANSSRVREAAGEAFDARKVDEFARSLKSSVADGLIDAGRDGGAGLRRAIESELRKPIKLVVEALLQPYTQGAAQFLMGGANRAIGGGLGGLAGGAANFAPSVFGGGTFGGGVLNGLSAWGEGGSVMGVLSNPGTYGVATTLGAALPIIGGAALAYSLLSGKGGGPKSDGRYGYINSGISSGSGDASVRTAVKETQAQYDAYVKSLGIAGGLRFGAGVSTDPAGDSPSFVDVTTSRNGQTVWTKLDRNVGRGESEVQAALQRYLQMGLIEAIKGMKGELGDVLRAADIEGDFDEIFERVTKALTERATLQQRLDDLVDDAATKLAKTRQAEIEAIDETNRKLAQQVYAQEDVNARGQTLLGVYNSDKQFADGLRSFVERLRADSSTVTTAGAGSDFRSTLAAAIAGDPEARSALTDKASAYVQAAKAQSSTRAQYLSAVGEVTDAMDSIVKGVDYEREQVTQLQLLREDFKTWAQARKEYDDAVAVLATATKARTDADALYSAPAAAAAVSAALDVVAPAYNPYADPNALSSPGFAAGGSHAGGWRIVGERGPELEATGPSRIFNAEQTRDILYGAANEALVSEMRAMREELRGLRAEAAATARHAYRTSKSVGEIETRGVYLVDHPSGEIPSVQVA